MAEIIPRTDRRRGFLAKAFLQVRRHWIALALVGSGIALGLYAPRVSPRFFLWVAVPAGALVALALVIFLLTPKMDCRACGRSTEDLVEYCPSCGEGGLVVDRWRGTICASCKRQLGRYKTRTYRIRFCTYCGVLLNRRGV